MTEQITYPLLDTIFSPSDLRALDATDLPALSEEIRSFLIQSISSTGGHLASNLGTIELTLALHYVFNTPDDLLVWDVGHQTYAHKVLTGRREKMNRLRMLNGISGFPKRSESPYDTFGVGHSSTSISAALGMATASKLSGDSRHVVAIIGDGAMSAGQAFEALNNTGISDVNLTVILNDNDMSISPPVGALNNYLTRLLSGSTYNKARKVGEKMLSATPSLLNIAKKAEEHVKGMIVPSTLFEELGFNYLGPIDGHNINSLLTTLSNVKKLNGPQFLHIVTQKGQGYKLAESDPILYHGVSQFDASSGIKKKAPSKQPVQKTYTDIFSQWLCDMAKKDDKLVAVTPAMREGSGLVAFSEKYPNRYFDVGIAEQHALTFAAGLACEHYKPVVAIYSTFLQRGYDQLIHDIAIQNLPITFAVDRGGLVGADGATHHGAFDLSYLVCIPNLIIMAPSDENECRKMLTTAFESNAPAIVRYPRGKGPGQAIEPTLQNIPLGKAVTKRQGKNIALLSFGSMLGPACSVGNKIDATVIDMRFIKPLDKELLLKAADEHAYLVTLEENAVIGGAGSEVQRILSEEGRPNHVLRIGLPDSFFEQADQAQLLAQAGLDETSILKKIKETWTKI